MVQGWMSVLTIDDLIMIARRFAYDGDGAGWPVAKGAAFRIVEIGAADLPRCAANLAMGDEFCLRPGRR